MELQLVKQNRCMEFRRGDIVWVRVVFPQKWWPGMVRSTDGHRVAVSFFDDGDESHYFLETEVFSFEENFESLVKTLKNNSRGEELLDAALKLIVRRAVYCLRCPCYFPLSSLGGKILNRRRRRRRRRGESVQPDALFSFVLDLAVSPFVGDSDFVSAVTMASQLNVFRRYLVSEQKLCQQKTTGACSVVKSSDTSKLGFESLNEDQSNSGSRVQVNRDNTKSLDRVPLTVCGLSFNGNHTREGCVNIAQQSCMPVRNSGLQAIFNFEIRKGCQRSSELQLSQPNVKANGKESWNICTKPYSSDPAEFMGLKRKYDHPVDLDFPFKLCKSMPLFSMSEAHKDNQKSKIGHNVCKFFVSKPSFSDFSLKLCNETPLSFANCTDVAVQRCEENTPGSLSSNLFDEARVEARYCLSSPASSDNYNVCVETDKLQITNGDFNFKEITTGNELCLAVVTSEALSSTPQVAQQSAHIIQMENSTSIYNHKVFVDTSRRDNINVPSVSEEIYTENKLLPPLVTLDASLSTQREAHQSADASIEMDYSADSKNFSVKASRLERTNAAFSLNKSSTEKNSQVDKKSASTSYGSCKNLYMKFPKDSNLPSKKDLIKKFRRFGQIDLFRTEVSTRMGSAQVVFLDPDDAVAAYQYSKRKKCVFGGANVLFWLDPYEKKRSHSKFAAPTPKLKSCLKNPYSPGQEDKKRARKVRFLMQSYNRIP